MTEHVGLYAAPSPDGRTTFCGPTAIAAATGYPVATVEAIVVKFRKTMKGSMRKERSLQGARVKSMWSSEIEHVCRALGFSATTTYLQRGSTFKRLAGMMQSGALRGPIIALVTGHYIAMSRWKFVDSCWRTPQDHARYNRQRQRVVRLWSIAPLTNEIPAASEAV